MFAGGMPGLPIRLRHRCPILRGRYVMMTVPVPVVVTGKRRRHDQKKS